MTIDDLMRQIEETERLIAVYRNADEVIVSTKDQIYPRRGLINQITLATAEIGDYIVSILERRLAAMRTELERLRVGYDCLVPIGVEGLKEAVPSASKVAFLDMRTSCRSW